MQKIHVPYWWQCRIVIFSAVCIPLGLLVFRITLTYQMLSWFFWTTLNLWYILHWTARVTWCHQSCIITNYALTASVWWKVWSKLNRKKKGRHSLGQSVSWTAGIRPVFLEERFTSIISKETKKRKKEKTATVHYFQLVKTDREMGS